MLRRDDHGVRVLTGTSQQYLKIVPPTSNTDRCVTIVIIKPTPSRNRPFKVPATCASAMKPAAVASGLGAGAERAYVAGTELAHWPGAGGQITASGLQAASVTVPFGGSTGPLA